jgi:hypothetical protein
MRRSSWFLLFAMFLVPQVAHAIHLHWAGGATDLTVSQNTQAILVVQADSAETALPNSWRLQWVADTSLVQFVAFDPNSACLVDTAKVDSITPPSTPADSAANEITAYFCSSGNGNAASAYFLTELVAGSHGKLKVVALNPADTTQVIESNDATFDGGIVGDYAPLVLSATQSRAVNTLTVTAVGSGLNLGRSAAIVSRDADWSVPLTTISVSPTGLTASAEVPASLPPALLMLGSASGLATSTFLPGDVTETQTVPYSYGKYHDTITGTRPKDFSFIFENTHKYFHLFFINTRVGWAADNPGNERYFGHVKSQDLRDDWTPNPPDTSFHVYGTGWESAHVWAPTVLQLGPTYYMFYTGVDAQMNQSIGVTTASDINVTSVAWARPGSQVIVPGSNVTWIDPSSPSQCRDPFVMRGPIDSTIFWMFYSTQYVPSGSTTSKTTIGVAWQHSNQLTQPWHDYGRLQVADVPLTALSSKAESPHAFMHVNARGDTSYYVCATGNDAVVPREDRLLRNRQSPWDVSADTTASHWNQITSVYDQLGFAQLDPVVFYGFDASEYCRMYNYNHEYLAGVDATIGADSTYSIWITMLQWINGGSGPDVMTLLGPVTDVNGGGDRAGAPKVESLRPLGRSPGQWPQVLEMTVPRSEHVELTVYDVAGRAVRKLADGAQLPGSLRVSWDGRDESGNGAGSGVYFARMRWAGGARVCRVVVLR